MEYDKVQIKMFTTQNKYFFINVYSTLRAYLYQLCY